MIREHSTVVVTQSMPQIGVETGDIGVVVHVHAGAAAYEVEFLSVLGRSLSVQTVLATQVRLAGHRDVPQARSRSAA